MKQFASFFKFSSIIALLCAGALNASAVEIVVNGGFESGSFAPGWTVVDPSLFTGVGSDPGFANSGNYYAFLGATPNIGSLSQPLSTTSGDTYTLSFFLANDSGVPPTFFEALFNGVPVFTLPNSAAFPYTNYTFTNLPATNSSTTLEFRYMHDDAFFRLDDVSVMGPSASVPEGGATFWLGLPVFGGLCLLYSVQGRARRRITA